MKNSEITNPLFHEAVEAIDSGNISVLQQLLEANPDLVTNRLDTPTEKGYFKNPYLLWFVADNPIRHEKLSGNIVEVTRKIIEALQNNPTDTYDYQLSYTLGLATFATQQRIKEIGVRKVLGATEAGIVALLSKDFIQLVVVSFIIAFPVAWWASNEWLQSFAYRINISWWLFAIAGLIAIIIAFATISFQAIKAAIANPVKSLRTE